MEKESTKFFSAVESGDTIKIAQLLTNEETYSVVNVENEDGKTPFQLALETKQYEIAELLTEYGIKLHTTLLRMIDCNNYAAVTFICEHKDLFQEYGQNIMNSPSKNDEYTVETTPLLLAAENNNYPIVKILMKHGASMKNYDEIKRSFRHLPTTQLTRIIYRHFNAVSSEAYLLQTNGNLLADIFNLFKEMKRAKHEKKGMNDEFETLSENLEVVSRKVMDMTRNEEEVRYLLAGDDTKGREAGFTMCTEDHTIPPLIKDALLLDVKGFVAHDKCQASLTDLWYQDLLVDVRQSVLKRISFIFLSTCLYPLLCVLYVATPCGPIRRMMRVPFVKFYIHTASRLTFLAFLMYATVEAIVSVEDKFSDVSASQNASDDALRKEYLEFRGANPNQFSRICIYLFLAAITFRELNDIRRMGRKMYLKIGCSVTDILQIIFYWLYFVFTIVAIVQAHWTVRGDDFINRLRQQPNPNPTEQMETNTFSDMTDDYYMFDDYETVSSEDLINFTSEVQSPSATTPVSTPWSTTPTTTTEPGTTPHASTTTATTADSSTPPASTFSASTTVAATPPSVICFTINDTPENEESVTEFLMSNATHFNGTMMVKNATNRADIRNISVDIAEGTEICIQELPEFEINVTECYPCDPCLCFIPPPPLLPCNCEQCRVFESPIYPEIPADWTPGVFAGYIPVAFAGETRYNWTSFDPILVAEAAFALANILTFGRLLQTVVMISGSLGVLAISLFGMVGDIVKFLILFSMTLTSFALGMTQLYRPFDALKLEVCEDEDDCSVTPFISLVDTMKTLFWALFGLNDLKVLKIKDGDQELTETLGHFIYALYLLVAVIVLLNALIAMMSSTYARVQENAEKEWKYGRSKMMVEYIYEGAVLPPPFNLIPDVWMLLAYLIPKKEINQREYEIGIQKNCANHFEETNQSIKKRYIFELQRMTRKKLNQRCINCKKKCYT